MSETNDSRRFSNRGTKRQSAPSAVDGKNEKKFRSCGKSGCYENEPTCCLEASDSCCLSGYTSRWYHLSIGEHFCNNCFDNFYRPNKEGYKHYTRWTHEWADSARASKPTLKRFVASEVLPYWVQCSDCKKWRKVRKTGILSHEFIQNFKCKSSCQEPEDSDVSLVLDPSFPTQLVEEPLLKNSPAAIYLRRFLPEDVGICPTNPISSTLGVAEDIELFDIAQRGEAFIWVKPDLLDPDEADLADRVAIKPQIFLGLRNMLVAFWNLTPSQWLTLKRASPYLICRGLVRIYLMAVAEQILDLITQKAVINHGIIRNPSPKPIAEQQVLVIGAGVAGLAAASHLRNLGVEVTVYEADSCLGGRIKDDPMVGSGAFFIQGALNNPFVTLSMQAGIKYQALEGDLVVFKSKGEIIPSEIVTKVQHEVNGLLHGAIETVMTGTEDRNCHDMIMDSCYEMRTNTQFCSDPALFNQLLSLCEIDLRADFNDLSLKNFEFPTALSGEDVFIPGGLSLLLNELAKDLAIVYDEVVQEIDYNDDCVFVTSADGEKTAFSKVLVTVPISALRLQSIKFSPPLPNDKLRAIDDICDYYCEKMILEFPKKFWTKSHKGSFSKFSILTAEQVFALFYDVTQDKKNATPTLLAIISQESLPLVNNMPDKEVVGICLSVLRTVFPRSVPEPSKWHVTHWSDGKFGGSFGSYLKVGSKSSAFDDLAKPIENKVYFAGEATFRNIPSTVTGAYLSGLREAANIIQDLAE